MQQSELSANYILSRAAISKGNLSRSIKYLQILVTLPAWFRIWWLRLLQRSKTFQNWPSFRWILADNISLFNSSLKQNLSTLLTLVQSEHVYFLLQCKSEYDCHLNFSKNRTCLRSGLMSIVCTQECIETLSNIFLNCKPDLSLSFKI